MRLTAAFFLTITFLASPAALADPNSQGEGLFQARCNMCHGTGMGGAPLMEKLSALSTDSIIEKMTTGTMAPMASGLSDSDKKDIAEFIAKKS
jgi:mono/diheme cytochrome c family protein